jgi:recombination protein RecR
MSFSPSFDKLCEALELLPSIGPKSARRLAYHLVHHNRQLATQLSQAMHEALLYLRHCQLCYTFTDSDICPLCDSDAREKSSLCVVETPADQSILEGTGAYHGLYYVLMGRLAPLNGTLANALPIDRLLERAADCEVKEIILATNLTAEGEATAFYLRQRLLPLQKQITRIAKGMPFGAEFEYVDAGTAAQALLERRTFT